MQLALDQANETALRRLGTEATELLCSGQYTRLAQRFGYALAFHREPAQAIKEDVKACLAQTGALSFTSNVGHNVSITYYSQNEAGLFALVACELGTDQGTNALLELAVTHIDTAAHVTLEQISILTMTTL